MVNHQHHHLAVRFNNKHNYYYVVLVFQVTDRFSATANSIRYWSHTKTSNSTNHFKSVEKAIDYCEKYLLHNKNRQLYQYYTVNNISNE